MWVSGSGTRENGQRIKDYAIAPLDVEPASVAPCVKAIKEGGIVTYKTFKERFLIG